MRIPGRPTLTMAALALATLCWAQDPSSTTQTQTASPSQTPTATQPTTAADTPATAQPTDAEHADAVPALPVAQSQPDAPAAAPQAPAPNVAPQSTSNSNTETSASPNAVAARPPRAAKSVHPKTEAHSSAPAQKDKDKAAEAAAASASSEPPQGAPPPSQGSTAPPATTSASEALPPAPGLPDPLVGVSTPEPAQPRRHLAWIPIGLLALGVAGAIALVANRRKGEDISIVDREDGNASASRRPMPHHS